MIIGNEYTIWMPETCVHKKRCIVRDRYESLGTNRVELLEPTACRTYDAGDTLTVGNHELLDANGVHIEKRNRCVDAIGEREFLKRQMAKIKLLDLSAGSLACRRITLGTALREIDAEIVAEWEQSAEAVR